MSSYAVGTVSQSGTTVTGVGTTFTSAMVGGCLIYNNGLDCLITTFNSITSLTVNISRTVSSQNYIISYNQFNTDSAGNTSLGTVYASKLRTDMVTFVDPTDNTKVIKFDASGNTTGTSITFSTISTSNRVITFPDITDTLVGVNSTQTLTNKTITGCTTSSLTNGGATITMPTTTDTLVGRTTIDTLTNKTITGTTNIVDANNLRNGSTWVVGLAGLTPTTNQVLTYNGTNAIWSSGLNNTYIPFGISTYTTGTASQSSTTITGVGTTFTTAMVGGLIVFSEGQEAFITAFGSTTSLTVSQSQTVSSTTFTIYYGGVQLDVSGNTSLNIVYNAKLLNNSVAYVDQTDNTKKINYQTSGATTATTTTLAGVQTANRVITFPDATDTLVGLTTTQSLTNKTMTDSSNNVTATGLFTATGTVNVSSATAPTTGQVLTATSSTTATWQTPSASVTTGFYGRGIDGTVTISSNTTLTRDMYYANLTVNNGITLNTGGFRIFVSGTLTLTGTGNINYNGNTASGATAGGVLTANTLGNNTAGGAGGAGAGVNGTAMTVLTRLGGIGGTGGTANSGGTAGGVGGTGTNPASTSGGTQIFNNPVSAIIGRNLINRQMNGGTGGGAGGGSGGNGGGGGSGGGVVLVCAYTISGAGTITATGGNGGNAVGTNAGGGGGGGGGVVIVIYNTSSISTSNFTANGGTGGTANGTGVAGGTGGAGSVYLILSV